MVVATDSTGPELMPVSRDVESPIGRVVPPRAPSLRSMVVAAADASDSSAGGDEWTRGEAVLLTL